MNLRVCVILFLILMFFLITGLAVSQEGGGGGGGVGSQTVMVLSREEREEKSDLLNDIYLTYFKCIDKCSSEKCPEANCKPDGNSIGWVGDCDTGSFTDCIASSCFDECFDDKENALKNEDFVGIRINTDVHDAIMCLDLSGEKGKDCITYVNVGTRFNSVYKSYLKYNCANSCWEDIIQTSESNQVNEGDLSNETSEEKSSNETERCSEIMFLNCPVGSELEEEKDLKGCIIEYKCRKELSNGRNAEIKVTPETASEKAIERLEKIEFNTELKEVGEGNEVKLVYEFTGKKNGKFFGIFKIQVRVRVQIDAETNDVVKEIRPWWSFLVSGLNEKGSEIKEEKGSGEEIVVDCGSIPENFVVDIGDDDIGYFQDHQEVKKSFDCISESFRDCKFAEIKYEDKNDGGYIFTVKGIDGEKCIVDYCQVCRV